MILARYQMNTQVYFHKIRRIYDHYLEEYKKLWGPEHYHGIRDVLDHDDLSVYSETRRDSVGDGPRSAWAKRIISRDHHRVVYETGNNADHPQLLFAKRLLEATGDLAWKAFTQTVDRLPLPYLRIERLVPAATLIELSQGDRAIQHVEKILRQNHTVVSLLNKS
jgi:hypothetical protein